MIPLTDLIAVVVVVVVVVAAAAEFASASFVAAHYCYSSSSTCCCCCYCYWLVASFALDVIAAPEFVRVAVVAIVLGQRRHCSSRKKY